jgi:hypothetical protein
MTAAAEENTKGLEKKNAVAGEHEVMRVLASGEGVATALVKESAPMMREISEKCRAAEGEVFGCLEQTVTRKGFDESVKLWNVGAVGLEEA